MSKNSSQIAQPSVGVIMPTYNGHAFIRAQIESLLTQEDVLLHFHVFDDESSDDTVSILEEYAAAHPGLFTLNVNQVNSGGTGLNIFHNLHKIPTSYDFIAFADQDDIWLPRKLASAVKTLQRDGSGLYFSNLLCWDGEDTILSTIRKDTPLKARDHLFGGGSAGCTYVMTATFFEKIRQEIDKVDLTGIRRISHDWIIYFLARHHDFGVSASSDALIKYRIHASSQYGGMSIGGLASLVRKADMVRDGFLKAQVDNVLLFASDGSEDQAILHQYKRGISARLSLFLRYGTSLARSRSRFLMLLISSITFGAW